MIKVLSVIGTRPEAIKMAPVIQELRRNSSDAISVVCSTGQHREMLHQVFSIFDLKPDIELDVMRPDQSLAGLTSALLTELDRVVHEEKPDWILAQGDTTSVMVASLLAFYHGVSFAHVEAGLRTGQLKHPFPEEANRRIADLLATIYFAPTAHAKNNLLGEGAPEHSIVLSGNTVVDALQEIATHPYLTSSELGQLLPGRRLVLITLHRRESFGEPLAQLCQAIKDLSFAFPDTDFVYPVHLNPNVQSTVRQILSGLGNVILLNPVDYPSMVHLLRNAYLVLTDSGGIQEEAPSFGVPILVLRNTTERPEGVEAGIAKLVGTNKDRVVEEATLILSSSLARQNMSNGPNPYGDGKASKRIVDTLLGRKIDGIVEK